MIVILRALFYILIQTVILSDSLVFKVVSEIPLGAGLGSSAALSVCLAAGLTGVLHQVRDKREQSILTMTRDSGNEARAEVCRRAFLSEKILHGTPSGIDNSVSSYGGIIRFVNGVITNLPSASALSVLLGLHGNCH